MDTPFKWVKQVPSHFGGTAQGVVMSWPGHINDTGGIRRQFHHVIDIVPTILEATGIAAPDTINGIEQRPIEGVSMVYTWDKANANAPTRHTTQYSEMLGNRSIYHDGWVAATTPVTLPWELSTKTPPDVIAGYNWELYNVQEDPTEFNDLATKMPEKLKECRTSSIPRQISTTCCRSTIRRSRAGTRRARALRQDERSSRIRASWPAPRRAPRRAS
jgi:arylsulfatase A-like enzyme